MALRKFPPHVVQFITLHFHSLAISQSLAAVEKVPFALNPTFYCCLNINNGFKHLELPFLWHWRNIDLVSIQYSEIICVIHSRVHFTSLWLRRSWCFNINLFWFLLFHWLRWRLRLFFLGFWLLFFDNFNLLLRLVNNSICVNNGLHTENVHPERRSLELYLIKRSF